MVKVNAFVFEHSGDLFVVAGASVDGVLVGVVAVGCSRHHELCARDRVKEGRLALRHGCVEIQNFSKVHFDRAKVKVLMLV